MGISGTAECQEPNLCEGLMRNFRNNYLTCRRVLLVKAVMKLRTHPGTQGSLPCSQEPASCPYPKPQQYVPHPPILFHCSSWLFPSGFLHHNLSVFPFYSVRATCLAPLILRNLITRTVFGERCKPQGFSVCSLLQLPPSVPISSSAPSTTGNTSSVLSNGHVLRQTEHDTFCTEL